MTQLIDEAQERVDQTRSSLTGKLETLEHEVTDALQGAAATMTATVTAARKTVHDTVESVQRAFDFPRQVRRHPWATVVASVVVGYVLGRLAFRHRA